MNKICKSAIYVAICLAVSVGCRKEEGASVKLRAPSPALESVGLDNAVIVWEEIDNAQSYEIFLNSMTTITAEGNRAVLKELQSGTGYTVRMRAIPSGDNSTLEASGYGSTLRFTTGTKTMLSTPELSVDKMYTDRVSLSWRAVKNADRYILSVDGDEQTVQVTSFTLEKLEASTGYLIMVKAVPSVSDASLYYESEWAEIEIMTNGPQRLSIPELSVSGICATGFTVNWASVENADSYSVSLNDGEAVAVRARSYNFDGLTEGISYEVKVVANPSDAQSGIYMSGNAASVTVVPRSGAGSDTGSNENYIIEGV